LLEGKFGEFRETGDICSVQLVVSSGFVQIFGRFDQTQQAVNAELY